MVMSGVPSGPRTMIQTIKTFVIFVAFVLFVI